MDKSAVDTTHEERLTTLLYEHLNGASLAAFTLVEDDPTEVAFVVLSRRAVYPFAGRPFATHRAVLAKDRDAAALMWGHYDLDLAGGVEDYETRGGTA